MDLFATIKYEPWFFGMIEVQSDMLHEEVQRGTMTSNEVKQVIKDTISAGMNIGWTIK